MCVVGGSPGAACFLVLVQEDVDGGDEDTQDPHGTIGVCVLMWISVLLLTVPAASMYQLWLEGNTVLDKKVSSPNQLGFRGLGFILPDCKRLGCKRIYG